MLLNFWVPITCLALVTCAIIPEDSKVDRIPKVGEVTTNEEVGRVKRNHRDEMCESRKQVIAPIVAQNTKGRLTNI